MSLIDGIYISEDRNKTLTITNSNANPGTFKGSFISNSTAAGRINYDEIFGQFRYASDDTTKRWPGQISFYSYFIPTPKSYVISDHWNGIRMADGNIIMSGVRAYTTDAGLYDIHYFEKVVFTLTPTET